jgi:2-polyprenyl-3-methyl-5-hydroxy-6-metoxy-1,4-benzoquinol methylase
MFDQIEEINSRPKPFEFYTAERLWTDEHTSKKMLEYHLNETIDLASRRKEFITKSVHWIVSYFHVGKDTSIADFGCGPGLYTTPFAETMADVTGIDFSHRSIQYAKRIADQKALNISYFQQNYLDFDTKKRFDLITMIFCDYCALSYAQRKTLLAKFNKFLKPGGSVLLDVHSLNSFNNRNEAAIYERNQLDNFWSPDNYYGFLNTFKYDKEKITLDKYTIVEKTRTRVVYNWLQYFSLDSLKAEFDETGFEVVDLFSNVTGSEFYPESPDIAIVAKKKENT